MAWANPEIRDQLIADMLSQYDPLSDSISDFVQITSDTSHSYLEVDVDGGADNLINIVEFTNK